MAGHVKWGDVKRKVREQDPDWDTPEAVVRRTEVREQLHVRVAGARLAELRKEQGMTQSSWPPRPG